MGEATEHPQTVQALVKQLREAVEETKAREVEINRHLGRPLDEFAGSLAVSVRWDQLEKLLDLCSPRPVTTPPKTERCRWIEAWVGRCKLPSVKNGCCEKHQSSCCSCGAPATHNCNETGQFVCGFPLCDECEHTIHPDGSNGGVGFNQSPMPAGVRPHCRKSEQRLKPGFQDQENTGETQR